MLTRIILCLLIALKIAKSIAPPEFAEVPTWPKQSYYDEDGPSIVLNCKITEVPHILVWFRDGKMLDPKKDENLLLDNLNQSLTLEVPNQDQSGLYRCLAYNAAGNVSHSGTILITAWEQETRPRIVEKEPVSSVVHARIGDTVNISCMFDVGGTVEALMDLAVEWLKDGSLVEDNNHTTFGLNNTETNNKKSSLSISSIKATDYGMYQCYGENSKGNDSSVLSVLPPNPLHKAFPLDLVLGCSVGGSVVMVTLLVLLIMRRRYLTRLQYEQLEWLNPDVAQFEVPERKLEYDVFISYSSEDLTWVKDVLFHNLQDQGYQVCIDFKDFTPGNDVADNIMDAVYKSRKTIVLLSKSFLKSMWGQFELQQAHNKAIMQRRDLLVIIKYDNSKVPGKLMGKTFLDWSDLKVRPHFWTRLKEAVGEPGSFLEEEKPGIPGLIYAPDGQVDKPKTPEEPCGEIIMPVNNADTTVDETGDVDQDANQNLKELQNINNVTHLGTISDNPISARKPRRSDTEPLSETFDIDTNETRYPAV